MRSILPHKYTIIFFDNQFYSVFFIIFSTEVDLNLTLTSTDRAK